MARPRYSAADRELERRIGDLEARFAEFDIPEDRAAQAPEDHGPRINALELSFEAQRRIIRAALDTLRELNPDALDCLIDELAISSPLVDLLGEG